MLTKLTVRNFKRFESISIDLATPVVFIGPNNSGKTSAMQALALWELGMKRWVERYPCGDSMPKKRPGITINRRDLFAIPHPAANFLWRNRRTRKISKIEGSQTIENVRIEIVVEGTAYGERWKSGFEFDYANPESLYCRPLRCVESGKSSRMPVPKNAARMNIAYLPPMSGLAANETRLEIGTINVRIGEGRTAEILRNLCWRILENSKDEWNALVKKIEELFGVVLEDPEYVPERGEITMNYREGSYRFDLSCSGRGLQQTLLLFGYMHVNKNSVILLDEPDAHLETLRQRAIYRQICEVAEKFGNQIIAASHSEVVMNEAVDKDLVIAFVGMPHRIGDRKSQVYKALAKIGWDEYYQAENRRWVLYLEGSTDLSILQAFAMRIGSEQAMAALDMPYVHYVGNQPNAAAEHYYGLAEALPDLKGVALFDRMEKRFDEYSSLVYLHWKKREIENYLCTPETLKAFVRGTVENEFNDMPLFRGRELDRRNTAMEESIREVSKAIETLDQGIVWSDELKASDHFLKPLFRTYYAKLDLPNMMDKSGFHRLVEYVPEDQIDIEIAEKLNAIVNVANSV